MRITKEQEKKLRYLCGKLGACKIYTKVDGGKRRDFGNVYYTYVGDECLVYVDNALLEPTDFDDLLSKVEKSLLFPTVAPRSEAPTQTECVEPSVEPPSDTCVEPQLEVVAECKERTILSIYTLAAARHVAMHCGVTDLESDEPADYIAAATKLVSDAPAMFISEMSRVKEPTMEKLENIYSEWELN